MNLSRTTLFATAITALIAAPVFAASIVHSGDDIDWGADFTSVGASVGDLDGDGVVGTDGYYFPGTNTGDVGSSPAYITSLSTSGNIVSLGGYPNFVDPDGVLRRVGTWNPNPGAAPPANQMFSFDFTGDVPDTVGLTLFVDAIDASGWSSDQFTVDVNGTSVSYTSPSDNGNNTAGTLAAFADMLHFTISDVNPGDTVTVTAIAAENSATQSTLQGFTLESANDNIVADIGGDWVSPSIVPFGWEYLESTAATGGTEPPLTANTVVGNQGSTGFGGGANGFQLSAVLGDNANGGDYEIFGDGDTNHGGVEGTDLLVHPSGAGINPAGEPFVIARYTINATDMLNGSTAIIEGGFQSTAGGGIDALVLLNGTTLFSASGSLLRGSTGAFNIVTTVAEGDEISFVVGSGTNIFGDETAIRGTITLVPTPAALPAGLALIGLIAARRRR